MRQDAVAEEQAVARGLRPFWLAQAIMFLPLPEQWCADGPDGELGLTELSPATAALAVELSHRTRVAYVEQWTFAGPGHQAAIVWTDVAVTFGPMFTSTEADADPPYVFVGNDGVTATNEALRQLGVDRGDEVDEFAALQLGRHRFTEDWLADS